MQGDAMTAALLLADIEKIENRLARRRSEHAAVVARLATDEVAEYRKRTEHLSTVTRAMAIGDDLTPPPPPTSMDNGSAEMDEVDDRFWGSKEPGIFAGLRRLVNG